MFFPNSNISGIMAGADAPPNSSADARAGRTLYEANSGGRDAADSFKVLHML